MRGILPALTLSLLMWTGFGIGLVTLSNRFTPSFLPAANHQMHQVVAQARRIVLAQVF